MTASPDLFGRVRGLADHVLFPIAQDVDRSPLVPASSLAALAELGLFGIAGPVSHGGLDLDRGQAWRVAATIGGACGATFFVWAQHHTVVRVVRASSNEALVETLLRDLCAGAATAGVAFAHVRRPGPPAIVATRTAGGWRLDGRSPWTTSWGIADWIAVAAATDDGELVWTIIPGDDPDGVTATPLALPVFASTGTVSLRFDGCFVPDERIALIERLDDWRRHDRRQSSIGNPVTVGIAERAARLLADIDDADAVTAAAALTAECDRRAAVFDELLARIVAGDDVVAEASDHRAECIHLAQRATTALLAGVGGRGMDLSHPAQRLAREADFFVIQAQTGDGRSAVLRSV